MGGLKKSSVEFHDITHTYQNKKGEYLMGVTTLMKKHGLSPDYSMIAEDVLIAAAKRGTKVHEDIEMFDNFQEVEYTAEVRAYEKLNLKVLCSEYLVSDNKLVASKIDKVLEDFSIADIKTTSELHIEPLKWQLSIYAYLFEKQNPKIKVPKLYAIHIKGSKAKMVEIDRIDDAEIEALLECERSGEIYSIPETEETNLSLIFNNQEIAQIQDIENRIIEFEENAKFLEKERDKFRGKIYEYMASRNLKTISSKYLRYTLVEPTTRERIDTARLMEELPEIAEKYTKITPVKGGVRFKFNNNKNL